MDAGVWNKYMNYYSSIGWTLKKERLFKPMVGRFWKVTASNKTTGEEFSIDAPTVKIGLKKVSRRINHVRH